MVVNDDAVSLTLRGVHRFFASKLAPTRPHPRGAGNKKPDIIIGLELARQAGNSVWG
jgi:hypothetical protein